MIDGLRKENMINKLKNSILVLSLFLVKTFAAQDCVEQNKPNWGTDSLNCRQNVSLYSEFLKQKSWNDASRFFSTRYIKCQKLY